MRRHAITLAALAAIVGAPCALAQDVEKTKKVRISQKDEVVVLEVVDVKGVAIEYLVEVIELVNEKKDVTGVLEIEGEGSVRVLPPAPVHPKVSIGVTTEPIPVALAAQLALNADSAVLVADVAEGLAAQKAGLQAYDVITSIGDVRTVTQESLKSCISSVKPGDVIDLSVLRAGEPLRLEVIAQPYVEATFSTLDLGEYELALPRASLDLTLADRYVTTLSEPTTLQLAPQLSLYYDISEPTATFETEREADCPPRERLRAAIDELRRQMAEIESILQAIEADGSE